MKKHINSSAASVLYRSMLSIAFLWGSMLLAQTTPGSDKVVTSDTTEVIVGKRIITITMDTLTGKKDVQVTTMNGEEDEEDEDEKTIKPVHTSILGIDLGANWLMYNNSFNIPSTQSAFETEPLRSTHFALHALPTRFNMAKGHVSLLTAITFDNNLYQFRNNVTLLPNQPAVTMRPDSTGFKKNKLETWYAQIPLMLSFQTNPTNPGKNFHISLGGFAGLFLGANTKQKSKENGKVIVKDDFNLSPFKYGLTARIGYGNLELYSNYTMSPMFREGQGPSFNSINFGIALTGMM